LQTQIRETNQEDVYEGVFINLQNENALKARNAIAWGSAPGKNAPTEWLSAEGAK